MPDADRDPYEAASVAASDLAHHLGGAHHDVTVVLGSGWRGAADALGDTTAEVDLTRVYGFPRPTVAGHGAAARSVTVGDHHVLLYLGRVHLYEGHSPAALVHGVRAAVANGCRTVLLTNAAGSLREDFGVGTPVLISDHINLTGRSPLLGADPPAPHASRFVDLTHLYSARLRAVARDVDPAVAEGVYAALPGPHYETPAEIRMLRTLGADLVGMSTALEAIAAHHAGAEVLAVSLVTNLAAGVTDSPLDHAEVLAASGAAGPRVTALLRGVIEHL
jgi:purine-nucleoside phosphorylase